MKSRLQINDALISILEGLSDACLLLDDAGQIIFANGKTRGIFPLPESLKNLPLIKVIKEPRILAMVQAAQSRPEGMEREFLVQIARDRRVEDRFLAVNAAPIELGKNNPPYTRVLIRDQTERHATDQVRKDFVANASHELRTPLSIINGYLENLVDGVVDDPVQVRKCLQTMRKHGERIARIVEDMLTLSKFETAHDEVGPHQLRRAKFSCTECAGDVLERLHPFIESKEAEVTMEIAPEADTIAGDRFYWDQIFFNLVENALKENAPGVVIHICGRRDGQQILLQIKDNGVGIPREDLPFIFKRFYRVAKHHSQQIKGTGLGLSIVRRAVESHGGSISVDSSPGIETSFNILLPDVELLPEVDRDFALEEEADEEQLLLLRE